MFARAPFPTVRPSYAMAQARYAYLWGRFEQGIAFLQPLVEAYWQLRIADDTFLYMRGFPGFRDVWATLGALHELNGSTAPVRELIDRASQELQDCSFDMDGLLMSFIESGDVPPYLAALRGWSEKFKAQGLATGLPDMREAIVKALHLDDTTKANEILDAVELADNDFRWLDDMRVLAKGYLAQRAGDAEAEKSLGEQFRQRQQYLFEPHHVFAFRLVEAQEVHREAYQAQRKS